MKLDRLCDNRTVMEVRCEPMDDRHGREVLVVIAKMTWSVSPLGQCSIALKPSPIRMSDVPSSDKFQAGIRFPSDAVEEKLGTDIALIGTAYPATESTTEQDVAIRIESKKGTLRKSVKVYGPRVFVPTMFGIAPGPPGKLMPTPLLYELSFGGYDDTEVSPNTSPNTNETTKNIIYERRNPAGMGFAERRHKMVGKPAPPIEDPKAPLSSRNPAPGGLGPIPMHWSPRIERIGTHDDQWCRERAPIRPLDFDLRYNSFAPPDLWSETPLVGTEPVEILGATPEGVWRFQLPRYAPVFQSISKGLLSEHPTHLDSYLIDTDTRRVELCWRARIPFPKKSEFLEKILIFGSEQLPEPIIADLAARVEPWREAVSEEAQ